ncbi:helix-turn-helix domain-containing protein [Anaerovibrio sp.]|uniref:helix-turn-helix domain-containing protein n=1 Tax=Anaerovibrio sp. TaxID=1872532 RepID=UPI003F14736F
MKDFGNRLKKLRQTAGLTQAELADMMGVVPSAVGKYERLPDAFPSIEVLIKLADYFKVSTDYLLRGIPCSGDIANNINGVMLNSPVIQGNHSAVTISGSQKLSPESAELVKIYESLKGRERIALLNCALELEKGGQ